MQTETVTLQILIAEDSVGDVLLLKEALTACGLTAELQVCKDGEAALSALARCDAGNLPDLIIVDLNLPRVDGMDVLRYLRGLPVFDKTPVMVFTSSQAATDRADAQRFGANAYVTKPPTLDEFLATVGSAIHNLVCGSGSHENGSMGALHGWFCRGRGRLAHRRCLLRRSRSVAAASKLPRSYASGHRNKRG